MCPYFVTYIFIWIINPLHKRVWYKCQPVDSRLRQVSRFYLWCNPAIYKSKPTKTKIKRSHKRVPKKLAKQKKTIYFVFWSDLPCHTAWFQVAKHNVNHPKEKRASMTRCRNQGFGDIDHSELDTIIEAEFWTCLGTWGLQNTNENLSVSCFVFSKQSFCGEICPAHQTATVLEFSRTLWV